MAERWAETQLEDGWGRLCLMLRATSWLVLAAALPAQSERVPVPANEDAQVPGDPALVAKALQVTLQ